MKCSIRPGPFLVAFQNACLIGSASDRKLNSILKNVLLDCRGNTPKLVASDGRARMAIRVGGLVEGGEGGMWLLDREKIPKILATPGTGMIDLESSNVGPGYLNRIKTRSGKFELSTPDPMLYPARPSDDFPSGSMTTVSARDLKRLIDQTLFGTDSGSTRYALGCVLAEFFPGRLQFVSTDGRRICLSTCPADNDLDEGFEDDRELVPALMPGRLIGVLKKLLKLTADDDSVEIAATSAGAANCSFAFRCSSFRLDFPGGEGRFPKYEESIPDRLAVTSSTTWADAADLIRVATLAEVCTTEDSQGIDFVVAPGDLPTLHSSAADRGSCDAIAEGAATIGDPARITLKADYLLAGIRAFAPGSPVTMEVVDPRTAVRFVADGFEYVIQTMTVAPVGAAVEVLETANA